MREWWQSDIAVRTWVSGTSKRTRSRGFALLPRDIQAPGLVVAKAVRQGRELRVNALLFVCVPSAMSSHVIYHRLLAVRVA